MEKSQENAIKIADWLKEQKAVAKVIYPGLPEHSGYEIMKKQAKSTHDKICRKSGRSGNADYISHKADPCRCSEGDS